MHGCDYCWESTDESENPELGVMARTRLAYELGRLRGALLRGALLAVAVALGGRWLVDAGAWVWTPYTFALYALWSALGGAAVRSSPARAMASRGGALTYLMPLSLLRRAAGREWST